MRRHLFRARCSLLAPLFSFSALWQLNTHAAWPEAQARIAQRSFTTEDTEYTEKKPRETTVNPFVQIFFGFLCVLRGEKDGLTLRMVHIFPLQFCAVFSVLAQCHTIHANLQLPLALQLWIGTVVRDILGPKRGPKGAQKGA